MAIQQIIYVLEIIGKVIWQMPLLAGVAFFSALIAMGAGIYIMIISPIYFNYYLIPYIERQVGRKLEDHPYVEYIFLGRWYCRQIYMAIYLRLIYRAYKKTGYTGLPEYCIKFPLKKIGYTIDMAPRKAIFMSYALYAAFWITGIFGATGCLIFKTHPDMFKVTQPVQVEKTVTTNANSNGNIDFN